MSTSGPAPTATATDATAPGPPASAALPPSASLVQRIAARTDAGRLVALDALALAERWFGSTTTANLIVVGAAYQAGLLPLSAKACPDWVLPNEAGLGYYRMQPKGELLGRLLARAPKELTPAERVGLVSDVNALVASGEVGNAVALALVDTLSKDKSRHIVDLSIDLIAGLDRLVPPELRANYERLIKRLFRARAIELRPRLVLRARPVRRLGPHEQVLRRGDERLVEARRRAGVAEHRARLVEVLRAPRVAARLEQRDERRVGHPVPLALDDRELVPEVLLPRAAAERRDEVLGRVREPLPRLGECQALMDSTGRVVATLEITEVVTMRLAEVPWEHVLAEGENLDAGHGLRGFEFAQHGIGRWAA